MTNTDVLVVGAGPAGLALACGLRQHGVAVRVLDQQAGPATTSRANILHARGVEVLDRLGALGDLEQGAVRAATITTYLNQQPVVTMRFGDPGLRTARPALLVSQATVEAELRQRLHELGGSVEWNTRVLDATVQRDGVLARLGEGSTVDAAWLVGCDGAHSAVRKIAGIAFPGAPVADEWLLADVHADWDADRGGTHGWVHRDGIVGAMPMRGVDGSDDLWRLLAYQPLPEGAQLGDEEVLDVLRRIVPERTGQDPRIRDAEWTSVFRVHRRLADSYRSGRVLLAGDSAHLHSPFGGQGMLTGLGDAENLAWKLALVVHGRADDRLVDTYEAERRPLATNVLRSTSAVTRINAGRGGFARFLRDRVLVPLLATAPVQRRATRLAAQLWVSYRQGPLGGSGPARGIRAGDRVPDLAVTRPDGTTTRLHAELGGRWALVAPASGAAACVALARERLGENVRYLTRPPANRPVANGDVLLVRPDAHLAWRGRPDAIRLGRWLDAALNHGRVS